MNKNKGVKNENQPQLKNIFKKSEIIEENNNDNDYKINSNNKTAKNKDYENVIEIKNYNSSSKYKGKNCDKTDEIPKNSKKIKILCVNDDDSKVYRTESNSYEGDKNYEKDQNEKLKISLGKMDLKQNSGKEKEEGLKRETNEIKKKIELMMSKIETLTTDNKLLKDRLETHEIEIGLLKNKLGKIETRDQAKSLLNSLTTQLEKKDIEEIKKDKKKKYEIIINRIKKEYSQYLNNRKFKAILEVLEKAKLIIEQGNAEAHTVNLDLFQNEINEKKNKLNLEKINPIKIGFLIQLEISDQLFQEAYLYLEQFYSDSMDRKFIRSFTLEEYLKK